VANDLEKKGTGFDLVYGSENDGRSWIGRSSAPVVCEDPVNWPAIKHFCALVQDRNPVYWDEAVAKRLFGGIPSPPGMLFVWSMPPLWRPEGSMREPLFALIPLPGNTIINVATESEFLKPALVGDRLTAEEIVADVSPSKTTGLGCGNFITTQMLYRNQHGEEIARHRNVIFRYVVAAATGAAPAPSKPSAAVEDAAKNPGNLLPEIVLPITLRLCVHDAAATRDYFPGHHDRDYARAQKARDVYLNTMFFHGFVDRVVTDWAGPEATVHTRRLRMMTPVCVGDSIRTRAHVVAQRPEGNLTIHDVRVEVRTEHGLGAEAVVACATPRRS
jgi:acyl dehydratase